MTRNQMMKSFVGTIEVQYDEDANAAVLRVGEVPPPNEIVDIPIMSEDDFLVGLVTFDKSGRLVQIELLDALTQIGHLLARE